MYVLPDVHNSGGLQSRKTTVKNSKSTDIIIRSFVYNYNILSNRLFSCIYKIGRGNGSTDKIRRWIYGTLQLYVISCTAHAENYAARIYMYVLIALHVRFPADGLLASPLLGVDCTAVH